MKIFMVIELVKRLMVNKLVKRSVVTELKRLFEKFSLFYLFSSMSGGPSGQWEKSNHQMSSSTSTSSSRGGGGGNGQGYSGAGSSSQNNHDRPFKNVSKDQKDTKDRAEVSSCQTFPAKAEWIMLIMSYVCYGLALS